MKLCIIGSGVVGQATGIAFHMHKNDVIFYDTNKEKLSTLRNKGYNIAKSVLEAVHNSSLSFICVPTPLLNGHMDFSHVKAATTEIAQALHRTQEYHVIVVRSTVLPSTTSKRIIPLLEEHSQLRAGDDFGVCMNPEFGRQKSMLEDILNPKRIVIGEIDERSGGILENAYAPFNSPIFRTDLDTAEMIKYVANLFLATKISFFNEIHMICTKMGLKSHFISEVVSLDPRIGDYGIHGGRPFEGLCLPKDLEAFMNFVKDEGLDPELLESVLRVNCKMNRT